MRAIEAYPYRHTDPQCVVVYYRKRPYSLASGHGTTDHVDVYRDGTLVYVLTRSQYSSLYVGLAVYDLKGVRKLADGECLPPCGEVFLQTDHEQREILGCDNWGKLATHTLVRRLLPYAGGN